MFKYGEKYDFPEKIRMNITNSSNSSSSNLNNYNNSNSTNISSSSNKTNVSSSVKEFNHITHPGISDKKRISFAIPLNNPYWPENLWKDINRTLVYSYKNPEKSLKPPAYKTDKTIRFNSRFESGNLLYAYKLNQDAYHCIIDPDNSSSDQCQWFYFQMSNIQIIPNSIRKITLYISGFNKESSIISNGWKVFMYSEKMSRIKNVSWFRAGQNYSYGLTKHDSTTSYENKSYRRKKQKNNIGNTKNYTLQFQVTLPYDDDIVYLSYGVPYTFTDLNTYITRWTSSSSSLISCTTLCQTNNRKNCPLLTITAPNSPSSIKKKCIFLTARSHPGETNGSLILHGLIEFLLSKQPSSEFLLHNFIFKIVPMINIDGVIDGSYHIGPNGENMNRVWSNPDPYKNPVVYHTKFLMKEINNEVGIAAFIDFHGCSSEHGTFLYGCPYDESEKLPFSSINKERVFPKILDSLCDLFDLEKCEFPAPRRRNEAARTIVRKEFGVINSFTFKSSFGGSTEGIWSKSLYCESNWKEIGAKIAESLFHLLSVDKPSYLLKSIENSKTFSNSSSPRSKSGNSSFDSLNSSRLDEDATVIAIDTQDGIKIISGSSNLGQKFDMNSDQNSPSKFNSTTTKSNSFYNSDSNSNSAFSSNSRLGFRSESNSNSSSISNFYSNSSFNSSYAPRSNFNLNSNSSTQNPRTKSIKNSNLNSSSSNLNSNSKFSSNANSDSISNLSSYLASRINQNSKAADNTNNNNNQTTKPSYLLSSESESKSNLNSNSNTNSRYNSSARFNSSSETNSISKRNPSPKPQQNSESKYDMNPRPKMNSDSSFKSSSASRRNPSPKSSSKSDSNFSPNQNLTTKNSSNIRTRLGTDSSLDVKPSSSSPRTNIGHSSESNFSPNRNQTSKSASNIRSKFNSDSNTEPKPSLQPRYNSSPRTNYNTNSNSNSNSNQVTESKQNQSSKVVYSSPKPTETKQSLSYRIYSSPKPTTTTTTNTETKQSLTPKVYSSQKQNGITETKQGLTPKVYSSQKTTTTSAALSSSSSAMKSDSSSSLLSKFNSSSESNSGLIQRPTSNPKPSQINRPASRTKLSAEASELQQIQLKQQSENNSFLNTSECTSSWSSFQSTSTNGAPSNTSFKNTTIPSTRRVTFQSDIIQKMKPPRRKKKNNQNTNNT